MRARLGAVLLCLLLCAGALAAPAGAKEVRLPPTLNHLGSFTEPRGLAFDQKEAEVYAIDGRSEVQRVTITASAGQFRLKLKFGGKEMETGDLPFDIKEGPLQEAMNSALCAGAPCFSVTGGPGDATGAKPYVIRFQNTLDTTDVEELQCAAGTTPLTGSCSVTTTTTGVNGTINRYNTDGSAANFEALGTNVIDGRGGADKVEPAPEGLHFIRNPAVTQVAVDELGGATEGDIYVTQFGDHLVDVFGPKGEFKSQLTEYNEGGTKALENVCGVAVDSAGNVYVADLSTGIHKYNPAGTNIANFKVAAIQLPCTLAAGAGPTAGFLFVNRLFGGLFKVDASSGEVKYEGKPFSEGNTTVAVDPANGHVLAAGGGEVREFDASGESSATPILPPIEAGSTVSGVAVDGKSGKGGTVYLSRVGVSHLDLYGPFVEMPVVEPKPPHPIGATTATLRGTISADGAPQASCHFEYLTEATFQAQKKAAEGSPEPKSKGEIAAASFAAAKTAPCQPPGPFSGSVANEVSAEVEGLASETKYEFRLVGTNINGQLPSGPESFETLGKPVVEGGKASQVTATTALISGAVNPRGSETEISVQYVTKEQFEAEASKFEAATSVPAPNLPAEVSGSGDLGHATGSGIIASGSTALTGLATETGEFEAGQTISGAGIPAETVIVQRSKSGGGLVLSKQATGTIGTTSGKGDLTEGSPIVTIKNGTFAIGQTITGAGIPAGTTVESCFPHQEEECKKSPISLTLSAPVEAGATALGVELTAFLALTATSNRVTNLTTAAGRFGPGQTISGPGIPVGTTVLSAQEGQLVLSKAASERVLGAALSAIGPQPVAVELTGLTPDTPYVFRLFAQSETGAAEPQGEAHGFATFGLPAPAPPDNRVYEMVTPAQKGGEPYVPESEPRIGLGGTCRICTPGFERERMPMQANADGSEIAFEGDPFEGGLAPAANEYLAKRGEGGWQTAGLSKPTYRDDTASKTAFKALSADLSRAVLLQAKPTLSPEAPEGFANLYLREEGKEELATAITAQPPQRSSEGENVFRVNYAGANAGGAGAPPFSHVIFQANDSLTGEEPGIAPAAPAVGAEETDLYEWAGGVLHLVNVLPETENTAAAPNAVIGSGALAAVGKGAPNFDFAHAISDDGQRIFWSAVPSGQVYVREGGTSTLEIPDHAGKFLTATPDGSEVLLSDGKVYDLEDETLTDLTEVAGVHKGGFLGLVGASEDLRRVYFVDSEELGGAAKVGKPNLYLWEEGEVAHEGTISFIATLLGTDNEAGNSGELGAWHAAPGDRLAQATPDGRFLAFESGAPLSGPSGGFEVFEYDAQAKTLTCASCNPSGQAPLGPSNLALFRGAEEFFLQPQNLPPKGKGRLFFESQDALTQADANGSIQDVYEWEPAGVGDCARARGCVALISGGRSPKDSHFIAADAEGENVFFTTRERLVGRDKDDFLDIYDARVGGGFSEEEPAPCAGEACAAPIPAAPPFEAPSSSGAEAEGPAPKPQRCKAGFVRRSGKCVRRHRAKGKHRHHHAAHQRGGAR